MNIQEQAIGKLLFISGGVLIIAGSIVMFTDKINGFPRLPRGMLNGSLLLSGRDYNFKYLA